MIFSAIRSLICPFDTVERYIPKQGKILDIGCGHGIFSALVAKKSSKREVLGIDPADHKIRKAKQSFNLSNLKFKNINLDKLGPEKFDSVIILDVLYLLPDCEKEKIFKKIREVLNKGGSFILKEMSTKPKWLFWLILAEELLMVKLLKYTFSDDRKLYFLSKEEYRKMLLKTGFRIKEEKEIQSFIYHHMLFSATA